MQTKHILLDLGGVVFNSTGISSETINWEVISELNYKYGHRLNLGYDLFSTFLTEYNTKTQQELDGQVFLSNIFDTLQFNEALINKLRAQYTIYILSDNYRENIAYISKRYAFHEWAAQQFYSFQFEMTKSDPVIFHKVLSALELAANQLIFIDDDQKNISVAQSCGIQGIHYTQNEAVFQKLGLT